MLELLNKYPEINLLILLLLKNINERKNATIMAVDYNLFKIFFDLYNKIKIEIKDKDLLKTPFYKEIEIASNFLNKEIPKLTPFNRMTRSGHFDLNLGVPKIGSIIQLFGTSNRMKIYLVVFSIDSKNSNPDFQYLNLSSLVLRNKL
jgi:hypothetical protein